MKSTFNFARVVSPMLFPIGAWLIISVGMPALAAANPADPIESSTSLRCTGDISNA